MELSKKDIRDRVGVYLGVSIALYIAALLLPALGLSHFDAPDDPINGLDCLWAFQFSLAWYANPFLCLGWYVLAKGEKVTLVVGLVAVILGCFLFIEGYATSYLIGCYLWFGSMMAVVAGGVSIIRWKRRVAASTH